MQGTTNFILSVTNEEAEVIRDFLETTRECPIELSSDNIFTLLEDISNGRTEPDIEGVTIEYESQDPSGDALYNSLLYRSKMHDIDTRTP